MIAPGDKVRVPATWHPRGYRVVKVDRVLVESAELALVTGERVKADQIQPHHEPTTQEARP